MTSMRLHYRSASLALCAAVLGMGACASAGVNRADGLDGSVTTSSVNGETAYREYCAGCHETGVLGAPVAGDTGDWADRSQLWDAVLLDHALTGYLEMPARGGRMDLPDEVVRAAVEYMLKTTFPDRLHDCNPPGCSENGI